MYTLLLVKNQVDLQAPKTSFRLLILCWSCHKRQKIIFYFGSWNMIRKTVGLQSLCNLNCIYSLLQYFDFYECLALCKRKTTIILQELLEIQGLSLSISVESIVKHKLHVCFSLKLRILQAFRERSRSVAQRIPYH